MSRVPLRFLYFSGITKWKPYSGLSITKGSACLASFSSARTDVLIKVSSKIAVFTPPAVYLDTIELYYACRI